MSFDPIALHTGTNVPAQQTDIAIKVSGLGKCYQIYTNPRDRLKQFVMPRIRNIAGLPQKPYFNEFWALKDIDFEIKKGDTVGIVGRNGSGKSTLLQILCGTLHPSVGHVEVKGRVAALLELGAGFNPEFTGRENVYMNAAVLGLNRAEIDSRLQSIIDFADIGDFIDQPVKIYSSGMYIRLAFAVIAHVDADILIVDEALSVGDAVFTQKCMNFIREFQKNGTLLFVSHDMASVQALCQSAIWLGHGKIQKKGKAKSITESYLKYTLQEIYGNDVQLEQTTENTASAANRAIGLEDDMTSSGDIEVPVIDYQAEISVQDNLASADGWQTGAADILSITLTKLEENTNPAFEGGEMVKITVTAQAHQDIPNPIVGFLLRDKLGQDLFGENTLPFTAHSLRAVKQGQRFKAEFIFKLPMLPNGEYAVMTSVANGTRHSNVQHHYLHNALILNVISSKVRYGLVGISFAKISLDICDD
ncbi:ABC transporter ATP-binding protein [Aquirhabdus sp.]|uniref:ABC transporter ATP-binding protein n=1 Tax=Aquirhabdus sp. TaxID=2824160 RepID=UPI00396CDDE9